MKRWKSHLFVSYARIDKEIAFEIANALEDRGVRIWIDTSEIEGGARWGREIVQAITTARALLLVASSRSLVRDMVQKEIIYASDSKKPILPCFLDETQVPEILRFHLADTQRIDLQALQRNQWLTTICQGLARIGFDELSDTMKHREASITASINIKDIEPKYFDLISMNKSDLVDKLEEYREIIELNPSQGYAHLNMGLIMLHLGNYAAADSCFRQACHSIPGEPAGYFYLGLALCRGRRLGALRKDEISEIEDNLNAAMQINDDEAVYYYFSATIIYEYYLANGLRFDGLDPSQLINIAKTRHHEPGEVERFLSSIKVHSEDLVRAIRSS